MEPRSTRLNAVRWLIAIAIAAMTGLSMTHRRPDPLERLVAAATQCNLRPIEARLSDFPYAGVQVSRSADVATDTLLRLRGVAGEVLDSDAIRDPYVAGVTQLIAGNARAASDALESASRSSSDPRVWNDLAAARMELGTRHDIPELVAQSLADSQRALELDPGYLPARFNRALALDSLRIYPAARRAYGDYLESDPSSRWADEARQRLASLPNVTAVAEWESAKSNLQRACRSQDDETVVAIVRRFPQAARTSAEGLYLAEWADNVSRNDAMAEQSLGLARCIGRALEASSGERLLLDAVQAVEQGDRELLARAHATYRAGRIAYRDGKLRVAASLLDQAAKMFEQGRSPMALVAALYRAGTFVDGGDSADGLALLDALEADRDPAYLALHAQIETERALALGRTDRFYETIDATREALRQFEALHESDNETRARTNLMSTLTATGASAEAWRMRREVFEAASTSGAPNVLPAVLLNAISDEIVEGKWDTACALATELSKLDLASAVARTETLLWRDFARARATSRVEPGAFGPAHVASSAIPDPDLREEMLDKIHLAEADLLAEREPERARRFADAAISYRQARFPYRLPSAFIVRARASQALGDAKAAGIDIDHAMEAFERQRRTLRDDVSRDSYVGGDDRMFGEALELAAASGDYTRMFRIAEQSSARLINDRLTGTDLAIHSMDDARDQVPADTAIVHLTTLRDHSIGIVITRAGARTVNIPAGRETLISQRDRFLSAITNDLPATNLASELYDDLLAPLAPEVSAAPFLLVITDDTLATIPFSALLDRKTGRFVLEDHTITRAPSVSAWFVRHGEPARPRKRAMVAGDPAFAAERFPSLSRLTAARQEVGVIARIYDDSESILGSDVTRARLLASMSQADVIHIAAHAMANARDASLSVMLLTPDDHDAGLLSVHDVMRLRLRRSPIVVLAGCQTAVKGGAHGTTTSFALAFLAAGSRAVAGTLWNVDDAVARDFSIALHRDIGNGVMPAAALRGAQIAVMHARGRNRLRAWAGFQLYGYD